MLSFLVQNSTLCYFLICVLSVNIKMLSVNMLSYFLSTKSGFLSTSLSKWLILSKQYEKMLQNLGCIEEREDIFGKSSSRIIN